MNKNQFTPLAERCRPQSIEDYIGQEHILSDGKVIKAILARGISFSLILWGEPGSGKTTLARLIADYCSMEAHFLSAISAGVADVRKVIKIGEENKNQGKQTLLFLDEIHRFNKAQQDSVLGAVENGTIVLIGATTENPSFNVISPLLSRTRIIRLHPFTNDHLRKILEKALLEDAILKELTIHFAEDAQNLLFDAANGDARRMFNIFETAITIAGENEITNDVLKEAISNTMLYYDRAGDKHYDTISAFIKSMRGSDPNAAVFYLALMLESGEDPEFIARRMVIFASEDIGNASANALNLAVSTMTAVKNIGLPEAEIILSQCATFLASAPKSNASYLAIKSAKPVAKEKNHVIPLHIRNAPTGLMKKMGHGKDYKYPHDFPGHFVDENYLPETLAGNVFYKPGTEGGEKIIRERLKALWPKKYS